MKRIILTMVVLFTVFAVTVASALGHNTWTDSSSAVLEFEPLKRHFVQVFKGSGKIEETSDGQIVISNTIRFEVVYE